MHSSLQLDQFILTNSSRQLQCTQLSSLAIHGLYSSYYCYSCFFLRTHSLSCLSVKIKYHHHRVIPDIPPRPPYSETFASRLTTPVRQYGVSLLAVAIISHPVFFRQVHNHVVRVFITQNSQPTSSLPPSRQIHSLLGIFGLPRFTPNSSGLGDGSLWWRLRPGRKAKSNALIASA